jgi:hypothetical protein
MALTGRGAKPARRVTLSSESVTACQAQAASDTTAGLSRRRSRVRVPSLPSKPVQNGILCCLGRQSIPALETVARAGNAAMVNFSLNHAFSRRSVTARPWKRQLETRRN